MNTALKELFWEHKIKLNKFNSLTTVHNVSGYVTLPKINILYGSAISCHVHELQATTDLILPASPAHSVQIILQTKTYNWHFAVVVLQNVWSHRQYQRSDAVVTNSAQCKHLSCWHKRFASPGDWHELFVVWSHSMQWQFTLQYAIAYGFRVMGDAVFYTVVPDSVLFCRVMTTDAGIKKNLE